MCSAELDLQPRPLSINDAKSINQPSQQSIITTTPADHLPHHDTSGTKP